MLVVRAYRAYAALMFVFYVALAIVFGFCVRAPEPVLMPVAAAAFAVLHAVAFAAPREPWGWTLGLVAIVVGMAGVTIVVALPLLMAWQKPTTKAAFRRLP